MKVYRITKKKYQDDLSGKGAELYGGRWNPIGTPALYTSESRALCVLELLVHTQKELVPPLYIIQTIAIPDSLDKEIKKLDIHDLNPDWDKLQHPEWTEILGNDYFKKGCLGIIVPSCIIRFERNIVLNPNSEHYSELTAESKVDFELDKRLFR